MSTKQNDNENGARARGVMSRRRMMQATGAAGASAVALGSPKYSPVQEAEAIGPLAVAGGVALAGGVAGAGVGWKLREITGDDDIDEIEGATNDLIIQNVFEKARDRRSQNFSTFVDNSNIAQGIDHVAYSEGKIEFSHETADGASEADATAAAHAAVDEYEATVKSNLLKGWNETLRELQTTYHKFNGETFSDDEHDGIEEYNPNEIMAVLYISSGPTYDQIEDGDVDPETDEIETYQVGSLEVRDYNLEEEEYDLPNGEQIPVLKNIVETSSGNPMGYPAPYDFDILDEFKETFAFTRNSTVTESAYHDRDELLEEYATGANDDNDRNLNIHIIVHKWMEIFEEIEETFNDVRDGIDLWASETYDAVQDGDLDPVDLLSERELAAMTTDDEDFAQSAADLMALNLSVDLEREAEVYLPEIGATLNGSIARTGEGTLETGVIDPADDDETYYLTYDISLGSGEWDAYDADAGVDGGVLTLTEDPLPEVEYHIETGAGEVAVVTEEDFIPWDADEQEETLAHEADTFIVDLSDQLEDTVTNVEEINFFSPVEETQFETVQLRQEFEILTFTDSDGNEEDSAEFSRSEPHTDDNYLTQEEWENRQARHDQLVQEYQDALEEARGGGGLALEDFEIGPVPGVGVVAGIGLAVLYALTGQN